MRELHWFLPRYVLFLMVTIMQGSCFVVMFLRFSCAYIICVCVGGWVLGVYCIGWCNFIGVTSLEQVLIYVVCR